MLLDDLQFFEWMNEPIKINYSESGMEILTNPHTDFWQSKQHKTAKDNGHFFFRRRDDNFSMTVHWSFVESGNFKQCGLMLRIDERNWIKVGIMSQTADKPQLGTVVTSNGYSDWATYDINGLEDEIWFKIKRNNGDYLLFYSTDGNRFKQLRMFHFRSEFPEVKVGAFACSPQNISFDCTIKSIEFK